MTKKQIQLAVLTGLILLLSYSSGFCEQSKSRLELDHGTSHKLQIANQTLNPDAGKNLKPVEGFDGIAAEKTVNKYRKEFATPQKEPIYTFTIGGKQNK